MIHALSKFLKWSDEPALLGDFRLSRAAVPALLFVIAFAVLYLMVGWSAPTKVMAKLWLSFAVAFVLLAAFARMRGANPPLRSALAVAMCGVALGGATAALVVVAPNWSALLDWRVAGFEWLQGASFCALLVGMSLASGGLAYAREQRSAVERHLLQSRLQTLQAQIEPHFLMNTLANLRYLIQIDSARAFEMSTHLADFLQVVVEGSRNLTSTLGRELALAQSYLSIMKIRLQERLQFNIECSDELRAREFPPLLLQTLVENAIKHGIEPSRTGGHIGIDVRCERGRLTLQVADSGAGVPIREPPGNGLGLKNVRERLAAMYGDDATLALIDDRPGTRCVMTIPT